MKVESVRVVLTKTDLERLLAAAKLSELPASDPLCLLLSASHDRITQAGQQYKWICERCHGEDISMDGNLTWDPATGEYIAEDAFEDSWCSDCEEECRGIGVPVEWKDGDPVFDIFGRLFDPIDDGPATASRDNAAA